MSTAAGLHAAISVTALAASNPPVPLRALGTGVGVVVLALGLWLLWSGRRPRFVPLDDQPIAPAPQPRLVALRNRFSPPTRMAIGLSLALIGYHGAVYSNPGVQVLHVPFELSWVLLLGFVVTVAASLGMDRLAAK